MNTVNSIGLITKYSDQFFDKVYKQDSVTSVLDTTDERVKFIGAKTVKIAKMQFGGLSNYYRNNAEAGSAPAGTQFYGSAGFGYQQSNAKMQWETFTLSQDRAASFPIEYFDDEESGGLLVGNAVTEISRTIIVPEIDAYALSTLAANAGATKSEAITSANALSALNDAFLYFEEHEVPAADQVIYVSPAFMKALRESTQITRFIDSTPGEKKVNYKITEYEGRTLITVPPTRFRTKYKAYDGGYGFDSTSKPINFLAVSKSAVIHIKKYEKVKIVSGDLNLAANGFDGYTVYARVYHDVFVPDNKKFGIYANVATTDERPSDLPAKLTVTNDKTKIASIKIEPADQAALAVKLKTTPEGTINVGDKLDPANVDLIHVGDTFSAGKVKFYAMSGNYTVLSIAEVTFTN